MTTRNSQSKKKRRARSLLTAGAGLAVAFLGGCGGDAEPGQPVGLGPISSDGGGDQGTVVGIAPLDSGLAGDGPVGLYVYDAGTYDAGVVGVVPYNPDMKK